MNINLIRAYIHKNIGKKLSFKYNSGRGQLDKFEGIIDSAYKGIFVVKIIDNERKKAFSYSDILIKNLEIL